MKNHFLISFLRLVLLCLGIMFLLRLIFWWYNYRFFPSSSVKETISALYAGSRFDASALAYLLVPVMLFYSVHCLTGRKTWLRLAMLLTESFLFFLIIASLFDTGFYSFSFQRSNLDTFKFATDSLRVFKTAPLTYAGLFAGGMLSFFILHWFLKRVFKQMLVRQSLSLKQLWPAIPVFFMLFIMLRGLNARPLSPLSVSLYTNANFSSVVTNNVQTSVYAFFKKNNSALYEQPFTDGYEQMTKVVPFVHQFPIAPEKKYNVVLLILESFSRAYLEKGNPYKAYTPFLDTVMENSFFCTNAYANGSISINGIQAILSGIPGIYDYNIDNSVYYLNFTRAMPAVFKERGYDTYFFYGANKDHFGLEKLTRRFGVDHYISEEDYNNPSQHNGYWGINDSAFFQFTARKMKNLQQPFFTTVFNISSHYPYVIPEQYRNQFPKGNSAAARSISFVDRSLQHFFDEVKKTDWYENTLFVFVADHWNKEDQTVNAEGSRRYQIPLFIYKPDGSLKKKYTEVTDQISLFPTLMQLTGYQRKFTSFGKSMLDTADSRWTVAMKQWPSLLLFTSDNVELYYDAYSRKVSGYKSLTNNGDTIGLMHLEQRAKSFVQQYNYLFTQNKLADTSQSIK